jgi:hypothetical protein
LQLELARLQGHGYDHIQHDEDDKEFDRRLLPNQFKKSNDVIQGVAHRCILNRIGCDLAKQPARSPFACRIPYPRYETVIYRCTVYTGTVGWL